MAWQDTNHWKLSNLTTTMDPTWLKKFYAATGPRWPCQKNADQLQSRRWRTNLGHEPSRHCICQRQAITSKFYATRTSLSWTEAYFKYLYSTRNNSIYYRRTQPQDAGRLPEGPPPTIIVTSLIYFYQIDHNTMLQLQLHMQTLIGQPVSRLYHHLLVHVSSLPEVS